jgi:hypothetical protein
MKVCVYLRVLILLIRTIDITAYHAAVNWGIKAHYGSSNLCRYQLVNQEIFYSIFLLYAFICDQYVM